VSSTFTNFSIDLSGPAYQGISTAMTFRLYGYTPATNLGLYYDNLTLSGQAVAVPEPPTAMRSLAGFALLVATGWRRSRSRRGASA
jgi:hypothetical protein